MKNKVMAICDKDVSFGKSFADYVNKKSKGYFFAELFTELELMIKYGKEKKIDVFLISEELFDKDLRSNFENASIIILTKNREVSKEKGDNLIYKYQSGEDILKEIMSIYGNVSNPDMKIISKKCQVVGIYSPVGADKTSFALSLGQIMAQNKRCLYINTQNCAGLHFLLDKEHKNDLSDVIYYLRQENINFIAKLEGMVNTINALDYIPPVEVMTNIREVKKEEWIKLIKVLKESSTYEIIVMDFDESMEAMIEVLGECDKIYIIEKKDFVSQAKMKQFEKNIELCGSEELLNNIEKIEIPDTSDAGTKESYINKLVWGELANYVRELIDEKGR